MGRLFRLAEWMVDPERGLLMGADRRVRVEPRVMQVLACLADRPADIVTREELIETVWGRVSVSQEVLTSAIRKLRAALCDDAHEPRFIQTIPGKGYRLLKTPLAPVPSIAVLPFTDMSPEKNQEYLCHGITEAIIHALTQVEGLKVAARTSAFQFQETTQDIRTVGKALNVDTVLEGSVRTTDHKLRITAQLTNVGDGFHLWSEQYERYLEDVFAIQDEITSQIVQALKTKMKLLLAVPDAKRRGSNLQAYHAYMKGRYSSYKRSQVELRQAIGFFETALEKDPSYAPAHAGLADCYSTLGYLGFLMPKDACMKARHAAHRALDLEESLAEAHAALATIRFWFEWDWVGAEKAFMRALELDPTQTSVHARYGVLLACLGRQEEAVRMLAAAEELDPLSPVVNYATGLLLLLGREPEKASAEFQKIRETNPGAALFGMAAIHILESDYARAIETFLKAETVVGRTPYFLGVLGNFYGRAGQREDALRILHELEERAEHDYIAPVFSAWVYGGIGQWDQAFHHLDRAYIEGDPYLIYLNSALYDYLSSDPRYDELIERMNLTGGGGPK